MTRKFEDTIPLPDELTLGAVGSIVEKLREYGYAELLPTAGPPNKVKFVLIEEDDWDLREVLHDIQIELGSWDINFTPEKAQVGDSAGWEMP